MGTLTSTVSNYAYGISAATQSGSYKTTYCMNAGEVVGKAGAAGIGAGLQMSYCLNVGRISGYSNVGGISASNSAFHSFSDEQMAPSSPYRDNSTRLQTTEMVGTALQSELGTDNWIYEDNMYPRLKWTETLTCGMKRH